MIFLALTLLSLTPAPQVEADSSTILSTIMEGVEDLRCEPSVRLGSSQCGPLLIDANSFIVGMRSLGGSDTSRSSLEAAIGRRFTDVPARQAYLCELPYREFPCTFVHEGIHVLLNSMCHTPFGVEAVVTVSWAGGPRQKSEHAGTNQLKFTFVPHAGDWLLLKAELIGAT